MERIKMQVIQPNMKYVDNENGAEASSQGRNYFDPMSIDGITLRCCCGYELTKGDDENYLCAGGHHTYRVSDGDVFIDKFGNIQLRTPAENIK